MSDLSLSGSAAEAVDLEHRVWLRELPSPVLTSYLSWGGLQLHSLTMPSEYRCTVCLRNLQSAMVATGIDAIVCPSCFATLSYALPASVRPELQPRPDMTQASHRTRDSPIIKS